MNAEIFFLEMPSHGLSQEGLARRLHDQLLGRGYRPVLRRIDQPSRSREAVELASRYLKLLQAAIPPERRLELSLEVQEYFGYRIYITVYHGYWSPSFFQDQRLALFFPAVAVHDRMVLVPPQQGSGLAAAGDDWLAEPLASGGLAAVDFGDAAAVAAALDRMDRALLGELLDNLRSYARYRKPGELDLEQAGRDLGVEASLLRRCLEEGSARRDLYRQLGCRLEPDRLAVGRWTKVTLVVSNETEEDLEQVGVVVAGPVAVLPEEIRIDLPAGAKVEVPLSMKPQDPGEFPVEITFVLPGDQVFAGSLPRHHLWLTAE